MRTKLLEAGQKFGKLTVVKLDRIEKRVFNSSVEKKGFRRLNQEYYLCRCECGKYKVIEKYHITRNVDKTLSCGCELGTHHKRNTRIYNTWAGVKSRCFNPNDKRSYKNYGGRGITMCDEWKNDFTAFYNWAMANGYKEGLTIERIDVNGNYEPSNCKWITLKEQERNRRDTIYLIRNGEKDSLANWADRLDMSYDLLYSRYKKRTSWFKRNFA